MSFEDIICEVQNKPELWFSSHFLYRNRATKAKIWKKLSIKLGIKEDKLKKRWKHLKDQYRKELKKQPALRSDSDPWHSTWQYYSLMSFMKDELMPAPPTGVLNVTKTEISREPEYSDMLSDTDMIESDPSSPVSHPSPSLVGSSVSQQSTVSTSSRKRTNVREEMLEVDKDKLSLMKTRWNRQQDEKLENDEDFLFLKSILPSMKKLNELQKLRFRGKINDWLLEAFTQNELAPSRISISSKHK